MRDHLDQKPAGARAAGRTVGVRELKTHAATILRQVRDRHASYILTHRGKPVGVILPFNPAEGDAQPEHVDVKAAWNAFLRAGHRLERRFRPEASGVRDLSDARR